MTTPGYDNGDTFISALSAFWTVVYQDRALLSKFMSGVGENFSDAYFDFLQSVLGSSLERIPVFHKKKWYFLTFRESDNLGASDLIYTEEGILYGPQPVDSDFTPGKTFRYGDKFTSETLFEWELPREIVNIDRFLMNRIHRPSLVLTKGVDFEISQRLVTDRGVVPTIRFNFNPFEDSRIAQREIRSPVDGVSVIDREIGIWSLNSFWDYEFVWENYGKLVGFYKENSESYKTFVRAIWDLFVGGPNFQNVEAGINAVLGLPVSRDTETIREIIDDGTNNNIVTNLNVYVINNIVPLRSDFFGEDGSLRPDIILQPFEPLTEVVEIKDSVSHPQWWKDVNPLIIPKNLIHDNVDFFLPENIVIYADMIIGKTWGLPEEFEAPNESFRQIGLRVGEWKIGDDNGLPLSFKFDYKNYIFEQYFKENVFFLAISPTVAQLASFESQVTKIILDSIPSYTTFLNYTFLDTILDDYVVDPNLTGASFPAGGPFVTEIGFDGVERVKGHNNEVQVLDIGYGAELEEELTDADYQDGYLGVPFVGSFIIGGFVVGTISFQSGVLVRSVCGN